MDHFCQQLLNSGYCDDKVREIVLSGLKGIQRKETGRKGRKMKDRSSHETVQERLNKSLLEATNWYNKTNEEKIEGHLIKEIEYFEGSWKKWRAGKGERKREEIKLCNREEDKKIQGVKSIQNTMHSEIV